MKINFIDTEDTYAFRIHFQIENETIDYNTLSIIANYMISGCFCVEMFIPPKEIEYLANGATKGETIKDQNLIFGAGYINGKVNIGILKPPKE